MMDEGSKVDMDIELDQWKISYILGEKYENKRSLEDETGVQIRVNGQRVISIKGTFQKVLEAKEKLEIMSADVVSTNINIQQVDVGGIIGKSGTKIKSLREESGASVQVITEDERNVVVVTGFRENVENAVKGVEGIIASKVTTEMVISKKIVKELLKDSGRMIKNLQAVTGTRMIVKDDMQSTNHLIQITGSKKKVENAREKVDKMGKERDDREKSSISLSNTDAQALHGKVIQEIQNKTGTKAFFFDRGPHQQFLVFSGDAYQIEKANQEVQKLLDDLSAEKLIWVPHASLCNYQNTLKDLTLKCKVSEERGKGEKKFKVPIKICGSRRNVSKAIQKLKDICEESV